MPYFLESQNKLIFSAAFSQKTYPYLMKIEYAQNLTSFLHHIDICRARKVFKSKLELEKFFRQNMDDTVITAAEDLQNQNFLLGLK